MKDASREEPQINLPTGSPLRAVVLPDPDLCPRSSTRYVNPITVTQIAKNVEQVPRRSADPTSNLPKQRKNRIAWSGPWIWDRLT